MLTTLAWFGILLTVIRKERMIKNVSKKFNSKKSKKLLTRVNNFGILLNVNPKDGWFIKKEMFFENWAKRQFE